MVTLKRQPTLSTDTSQPHLYVLSLQYGLCSTALDKGAWSVRTELDSIQGAEVQQRVTAVSERYVESHGTVKAIFSLHQPISQPHIRCSKHFTGAPVAVPFFLLVVPILSSGYIVMLCKHALPYLCPA